MNPIVICADIGSVKKGNFAWCDDRDVQGNTPSSLARHVADSLNGGHAVALGFECPLFVPLVEQEDSLTSARPGEGCRAWSAGAGCGALATGLVQVAWVLRQTHAWLQRSVTAHLKWEAFEAVGGLFLWEAFVSGVRKGDDHVADARLAVKAFDGALPHPQAANAICCTSEVYSLIGAALLRTGWSSDLELLKQPCLVVRPERASRASQFQKP